MTKKEKALTPKMIQKKIKKKQNYIFNTPQYLVLGYDNLSKKDKIKAEKDIMFNILVFIADVFEGITNVEKSYEVIDNVTLSTGVSYDICHKILIPKIKFRGIMKNMENLLTNKN